MIEAVIGLVGVIIGSVITIAKETWTTWREHRRIGSYSAIRLICILEEYADKCIEVVQDDGTSCGRPAGRTDEGQEYYEAQVETPEPPNFPDDISWRSIPETLMHRTLSLPNKARHTNRYIQVSSEFASPPDYDEYFDARQEGYAKLGLDALEIAKGLRDHFNIAVKSKADLNANWDPVEFLSERLSR